MIYLTKEIIVMFHEANTILQYYKKFGNVVQKKNMKIYFLKKKSN